MSLPLNQLLLPELSCEESFPEKSLVSGLDIHVQQPHKHDPWVTPFTHPFPQAITNSGAVTSSFGLPGPVPSISPPSSGRFVWELRCCQHTPPQPSLPTALSSSPEKRPLWQHWVDTSAVSHTLCSTDYEGGGKILFDSSHDLWTHG